MPASIFIRVVLPLPFSPQQGEDLTTVQGQIDAIVGDDAAETFGDVSQLNGANSFQGCHPFVVNWGDAAPVRFPDNI